MSDAPASWGGYYTAQQPATPSNSNGNGGDYTWKRLSDIQIRPLEFVQKPFLQKAAFHLLVGVKNAGKGTWLAHWAARFTLGELGGRSNVVWVAIGEDSYAMDVRPRIEAAGGDPAKVTVLAKGRLQLPDAKTELVDVCRRIGQVGFVVLDPLGGTLAGDKSTNRDSDIRPALTSLNEAADETGAIVAGVRHLSIKHDRRQGGALSAILGSSDWVNIPRAVLALVHDDIERDCRHLFVITGNRVRDDTPGLMFRIEGHTPEGWTEEVTVARELGESQKDPDELLILKRARQATKTDAARTLILETLHGQPGHRMNSEQLDAEVARRTGAAAKTIRNLRSSMGKDGEGLLKAIPVKDEDGLVLEWHTALTAAAITDFVTPPDVQIPNSGPGLHSQIPSPDPSQYTPDKGSGQMQGLYNYGSPDPELDDIQIPNTAGTGRDLDSHHPENADFVTPPDDEFPF